MGRAVLNKRMRKALERLRFECDYDKSQSGNEENFVLKNRLAPDIGDKTLSDLLELGLIETGINRWYNTTGYRITQRGRQALKEEPPKPLPRQRAKLGPPKERLRPLKGRLDR